MTYEQITDLLSKGFTPDQITSLTVTGVPTAPVQDAAAEEADPLANPAAAPISDEAAAVADADPASDPAPETSATDVADIALERKEILNAIADLKKSVQANNIRTMSMDAVGADNQLEKAMAELIRPSFEKGE